MAGGVFQTSSLSVRKMSQPQLAPGQVSQSCSEISIVECVGSRCILTPAKTSKTSQTECIIVHVSILLHYDPAPFSGIQTSSHIPIAEASIRIGCGCILPAALHLCERGQLQRRRLHSHPQKNKRSICDNEKNGKNFSSTAGSISRAQRRGCHNLIWLWIKLWLVYLAPPLLGAAWAIFCAWCSHTVEMVCADARDALTLAQVLEVNWKVRVHGTGLTKGVPQNSSRAKHNTALLERERAFQVAPHKGFFTGLRHPPYLVVSYSHRIDTKTR